MVWGRTGGTLTQQILLKQQSHIDDDNRSGVNAIAASMLGAARALLQKQFFSRRPLHLPLLAFQGIWNLLMHWNDA